TIYAAFDDGYLYAFLADGTQKWKAMGGTSWCFSSPTISYDGTIYLGWTDSNLYAFTPGGAKKWQAATGGGVESSPAIATDGTIYVGSGANLFAINPDGSQRWVLATGALFGSASIALDGTIYVGSADKNLYAANPSGSPKWKAPCGGAIVNNTPAIAPDGTIYIGADDFRLYAFRPDGSQKWSFPTGGELLRCAPSIDADGIVYVGSNDGQLYAVRPDGSPYWPAPLSLGKALHSEVVIGADGTLYLCGSEGLHAVSAATPSPTPTPSPTQPPAFLDVPTGFYAYNEIMDLVLAGVIQGYPDGSFRPASAVTRAEFAKMALLTLGYGPTSPASPTFPDVPPDHWAYGYVEGASLQGLVKGYPDGTYRPEGQVSLAEVLTVIVRARAWPLQDPPSPPPELLLRETDGGIRALHSSDWFYQFVGVSILRGILTLPDYRPITEPRPGGALLIDLKGPAPRAQVAVFLDRMLRMAP
ncbi:MAG: PQQ-binding-like beta-propeller repeat protein, partial [Coprothermobacterota bacterium]|nr:PQQ-binding-like beta-propeller repeat protein [Coprothermobacterota bacterium]